jgi:signal transduction histidine kinase
MATIRVRARALDMLGRQQIAGIPTAISELFKNAHDAYADRVEIDYYRSKSIFVLRDDGDGMSRADFESRWLTLGTESKLASGSGLEMPARRAGVPERPIMGEKGVGRLAIASIGPQVLVLTRARLPGVEDELVAAFLHWGMFTIPGIDLSDIHIPVRTFPGDTVPSAADVSEMVAEIRANLKELARDIPKFAAPILADLSSFRVDPRALAAGFPSGPSFQTDKRGTHFIIQPVEETLSHDIDGRPGDDTAPPLIKSLIGFANTMTPNHPPPRIAAKFRDHKIPGAAPEELIAESSFFTPEEFKSGDHHISGRFDAFGQFRGTVSVYGGDPTEHVVAWPEAKGEEVSCGPFEINLSYVHGEANATKVPLGEWAKIITKLNLIGGLYLYRDGVRVLPYGNADYDFLNIEHRRSKSASYYFFTYRRMFGVIDIDRKHNANLTEKSGREGFRENRAYRQFKSILENFFVQLAADFFRTGGMQADVFVQERAELERNDLLRKERAKQSRGRREELAKQLDAFFKDVNAGNPALESDELLEAVEARYKALSAADDPDRVSTAILEVEAEAFGHMASIAERLRISKPRGLGLSRQMQRDWDAYESERARLETDVFRPKRVKLAALVSEFAGQLKVDLDRRRSLEIALKEVGVRERKRTGIAEREARSDLEQAEQRALALTREGLLTIETAIRTTVSDFERTSVAGLGDDQIEALRTDLEGKITTVAEREFANIEKLREQLRSVATEAGLEQIDLTGALEEEMEALKAKEFAGLQLAQVGMALGIVHHEFASTINSVRNNLKRLKPWADANARLAPVYKDMRNSFEHLDGYLTLFTPLNRRLNRRRAEITGVEIRRFLADLFDERLARHKIKMSATSAFLQHKIVGYHSSILPCFVNLVDNSIFWLVQRPEGSRVITLDASDEGFVISDKGPGIRPRDLKSVFEMGFTRKPGGRGLGLYISREVLARAGYDLTLDPFIEGEGATFRIKKKDSTVEAGLDGDDPASGEEDAK